MGGSLCCGCFSSLQKWTARSACSIKYAFIVPTPMKSHLDATGVTHLRAPGV
jgi:hypothetical protein